MDDDEVKDVDKEVPGGAIEDVLEASEDEEDDPLMAGDLAEEGDKWE